MTDAVHGEGAARSLLDGILSVLDPPCAFSVLKDVASSAPRMANDVLNDLLVQGHMKAWADEDLGRVLLFSDQAWITELPSGLQVSGGLFLPGCAALERLPEGLGVGGTLALYGCPSLTGLSDGLRVGHNLELDGCVALTGVPTGTWVGGSLFIRKCPEVREFPAGLWVGRSLILNGCSALERLPDGLHVGSDLDLRGCKSWDGQVPSDAKVGVIWTDHHPHAIPLRRWRQLHPNGERG